MNGESETLVGDMSKASENLIEYMPQKSAQSKIFSD